MSDSKNREPRCEYRSPSGRRCRKETAFRRNMCLVHCDFHHNYAAAEEIVSNRDRLDTAEGILAVMARVVRAQAAGKILARDATAIVYSCQTMLCALPRLMAERTSVFIAEEQDAWREKALTDAHHDKIYCDESSDEEDDGKEPEEK